MHIAGLQGRQKSRSLDADAPTRTPELGVLVAGRVLTRDDKSELKLNGAAEAAPLQNHS
jgi:hypothetical protein